MKMESDGTVVMTRKEWKESIDRSAPCSACGCRLLEISEDGPRCARCSKPWGPKK
jgi:hypothetical protein